MPHRARGDRLARRRALPGRRCGARVPWIPIVIISVMVVMAVFAPLLAPYSPIDQTLRDKLLPPAWLEGGSDKYLLGTDAFGRDMLSRLDLRRARQPDRGAAGADRGRRRRPRGRHRRRLPRRRASTAC